MIYSSKNATISNKDAFSSGGIAPDGVHGIAEEEARVVELGLGVGHRVVGVAHLEVVRAKVELEGRSRAYVSGLGLLA